VSDNIEDDLRRMALIASGGRFNGDDYVPTRDDPRLRLQVFRVFACMVGGRWLTLKEIAQQTGDPPASISAQLRHLRKPRFGAYVLHKRHRGDPAHGYYEYKLEPPAPPEPAPEPTPAPQRRAPPEAQPDLFA
jgi:hypothetical protein